MKNNETKSNKLIAVIIVGLMLVIGGGMLVNSIKNKIFSLNPFNNLFDYKTITSFDTKAITARIMEIRDLITAKTEVAGTVKYEKHEEKFGPDAYVKYLLSYVQNIEAKIDLYKLSIEERDSKVTVRIPNPVIQYNEPKIIDFKLLDRSIIRRVSLSEAERLLEAKGLIPNDVQEKINLDILKEEAKTQARNIIGKIIKEFDKSNKYTVYFEFF